VVFRFAEFRSISNAVAERLEVTHQSPQLLVIKNGKASLPMVHMSKSIPWLSQVFLN